MSLYVDSELAAAEAETLVDTLHHDASARNDWFLYHLVGDAMRGRPIIDDGFSLRILAKLEAVEVDPSYDPLDPAA